MRTLGPILSVTLLCMTGCDPHAIVSSSTDLPLNGATHLVIETAGGHISVQPGPAGQLHVEMIKLASTVSEAQALQARVGASGDVATVEWDGPSEDAYVGFAVHAPPSMILNAQTGSGHIHVEGFGADMTLSTEGGEIDVRDGQGSVTATSNGGPITVRNQEGSLSLDTLGGEIDTLGAKGALSATTGGGSIRVLQHDGSVVAQTSGGSITIAGVLSGKSSADTSGGSVDVTVPGTSNLAVTAQTDSGEAINDFGLPVSRMDSTERFSGNIGDGSDGSLDLRTTGGSIELHRSN